MTSDHEQQQLEQPLLIDSNDTISSSSAYNNNNNSYNESHNNNTSSTIVRSRSRSGDTIIDFSSHHNVPPTIRSGGLRTMMTTSSHHSANSSTSRSMLDSISNHSSIRSIVDSISNHRNNIIRKSKKPQPTTASNSGTIQTYNYSKKRMYGILLYAVAILLVLFGLHSFFIQERGTTNDYTIRKQNGAVSEEPREKRVSEIVTTKPVKTSSTLATETKTKPEQAPTTKASTKTAAAPTTTTSNKKIVRYTTDKLCSNCRYVLANGRYGDTCLKKIYKTQNYNRGNTLTFEDAAIAVSKNFHNYCNTCHPDSCTIQDKKYYRLDDIGQYITDYGKTHYLQSIDTIHRLPPNVAQTPSELTKYVSISDNVYPNRKYFFEFNPSIIQLPKDQIPNGSNAVYIASYRVSADHACIVNHEDAVKLFGGKWESRNENYLGLALLDIHLNIVDDTVVDITGTMGYGQDFRLFNLNEEIYVGTYAKLHQIWVVSPSSSKTFEKETDILPYYLKSNSVPTSSSKSNNLTIYMRKMRVCGNDPKINQFGKNLNYFYDSNTNQTILERQAMGTKEVIDTRQKCGSNKGPAQEIKSNKTLTLPTFATSDELDLEKQNLTQTGYTSERGSACCVSVHDPRNDNQNETKTLLLGISHSKTFYSRTKGSNLGNGMEANHFFSSFYVMEPYPPYDVVARSGKFCLGFSGDDEKRVDDSSSNNNPYTDMQLTKLVTAYQPYDCPRIHFVSGITQKADDPSKIIIAYGLNDCTSRFVVVDTPSILRMLFSPEEL